MSIQFTVAVVDPVFPAASTKSNTNDPLALKVYVFEPELFVMVIDSLAHVRVATTAPLVVTDGEYSTVAVGVVVSIFATVAVAEPVFPAASTKSKVNDPLDENVYVVPVLLVTVIDSEAPVRVAITFWLVAPVVE